MPENENKGGDLLGVKAIGESIKIITKAATDGASAFLSRICLPAAEEFGLLLKDKVSNWRANNLLSITSKAESKFNKIPGGKNKHAHPRLVSAVIDKGSWVDNDEIQDLWAGLLVSSCSENGNDESNLLFINLLGTLSNSEALLLKYICENSKKIVAPGGWIGSTQILKLNLLELRSIMGVEDEHRIDRELDHLRSVELIDGGFSPLSTTAEIHPSCLALHMYVRCQGYSGSPIDYFKEIRNEQFAEPFKGLSLFEKFTVMVQKLSQKFDKRTLRLFY